MIFYYVFKVMKKKFNIKPSQEYKFNIKPSQEYTNVSI